MLGRIVIAVILVYMIPSMFLLYLGGTRPNAQPQEVKPQAETEQKEEIPQEKNDIYIDVLHNGVLNRMPMEQYVLCVTLAEMPADFELEALKAQAVVARTYTYKRMEEPKHKTAFVCTNSACCQAFISAEDYIKSGGSQTSVSKVEAAVRATSGQVLTYQGKYIEATYFSCSGGRTEDAQAVWGNDVPYLQSVESPGEEMAANYVDTVSFTKDEFLNKLGISSTSVVLGKITYTAGGGVSTLEVCGEKLTGTDVRRKLGLRSTAFVITATGDKVTVTTKGFGHRVGLSQYGAEAMAVQGKAFEEILLHYYQGTKLTAVSG